MIVFNMQTIPHLICYGKRLLAARIGLNVFDRSPFQAPTKFGLQKISELPVTSVHFDKLNDLNLRFFYWFTANLVTVSS